VVRSTQRFGSTAAQEMVSSSKLATQGHDEELSELAKLRQQVENLRQSVRARDDFIAIAAHELRNPMTPIVGVAELALIAAQNSEGTCPPRLMHLLERLQRLVQDYVSRATRLLDISRLEAGKLQLERQATDLSSLVPAVAQRYEAEAAHQGCMLESDIENGIIAECDPLAVEQIFENLLSNALKFGAGKPVAIRLCSDGISAQLEVKDRGIGISSDHQARIFGRFEQVVADHSGGGFGLGLWITNRLVEAMNGRITLSSSPGEGATFRVVLPLNPSTSAKA
jgi:two-component system, OmpR family, sensor kinase